VTQNGSFKFEYLEQKKSSVGLYRSAPKLGLELEGLKEFGRAQTFGKICREEIWNLKKKNVDRQSMTISF